jgi:hypothetical protein
MMDGGEDVFVDEEAEPDPQLNRITNEVLAEQPINAWLCFLTLMYDGSNTESVASPIDPVFSVIAFQTTSARQERP